MALLLEKLACEGNLDGSETNQPLSPDIDLDQLRELTDELVIAQLIGENGKPLSISEHEKISVTPESLQNENPQERWITTKVLSTVVAPCIGRLSISAPGSGPEMLTISPDVNNGSTMPDAIIPLAAFRCGKYTLSRLYIRPDIEESAA